MFGKFSYKDAKEKNNMKTFTLKTRYGTYENCFFRYGKYLYGDKLYVGIFDDKDPITDLTVNLITEYGDETSNFLDVNNFPEGLDLVEKMNLAENTGIIEESGYCFYPLYKFNIDVLKKYGVEVK